MTVKTTLDYLNDLKELSLMNGGTGSDYAVAKMLGITPNRVSNYKLRKTTFDDEVCIKAAELLSINPLEIIAAVNLEGKRGQRKATFWQATYTKAAGTALGVIMSFTLIASQAVPTGPAGSLQTVNNIHYAHSRRRRRFPLLGLLALALVLTWPLSPVQADSWTTGDTWRESAWQAIHLVDWRQTHDISNQCHRGQFQYYEQNPALKTCPTRSDVNRYFAASALLHGVIASALPVKYRSGFQYITIGFSSGIVLNNYRIGLKVSF